MSATEEVITVLPAPEGYQVDFANPTRDWPAIHQTYWIYGIGTLLALFFLIQNIYVKLYANRKLDGEALSLLLSWALSIIVQAILIFSITAGLSGTHAWEMPIDKYNYWSLLFYVSSTIYTPTTGFAKLSLLLFYRRISPAQWWIWCVRVSIVVLGAYSIAVTFAMLFACTPVQRSWDVTITEGSCIDRPKLYIAIAALQIMSDAGLIIMPMPMIYNLQMPLRQKIGLIFMFVVGSSTLVTSIMRLVTLIPALSDTDQPWALSDAVLWIMIEGNLLTICASFPTVRRFLGLVAPRWIGETKKSSRKNHTSREPSLGQFEFKTFGASGTRKQLDTIGLTKHDNSNEELELGNGVPTTVEVRGGETFAEDKMDECHDTASASDRSISTTFENPAANSTWDSRPVGDGEQAIIQTRSYNVTSHPK